STDSFAAPASILLHWNSSAQTDSTSSREWPPSEAARISSSCTLQSIGFKERRLATGERRPSIKPVLDPRAGDVEDDASSTKSRSLLALRGTLLSDISLPNLLAPSSAMPLI